MADDRARLEALLTDQFDAFAAERHLPSNRLPLRVPLAEDEATGFMRAIDRRLIRLAGGPGQFELVGVRQAGESKSRYSLFSGGAQPVVNRQYLMQVVALGELYFDLPWRGERLVFERDGFDVMALEADGSVAIGAVVDKDAGDMASRLERIIAILRGSDDKRDRRTGHVVDGIASRRPATLWVVAPGMRQVHDLDYTEGEVRVLPAEGLPSPAG